MFSTIYKQRRSFPELVGRNVEQAAAYITTLGIITFKKKSDNNYIKYCFMIRF